MVALQKKIWTVEEYLAFERDSQERHDFVNGEIFMMTGASENHNLIVANTIIALGIQLRGRPCKLYPSDMLVEVAAKNDYHYPDISVVCGEALIRHEKRDMLLNPTVIIEVLSPSTESYDRGKKFHNYATIPSLRAYLLIAQDRAQIECYRRQEHEEWLYSNTSGLNVVIEIAAIEAKLPLAEVYDKVTFAEAEESPT